ncbi:MAG: calcium-binding protein [Pleurocapsa sp. MO_226.B13]|nr:calcium-binding protein [Pleurocapsa sp. MO_226.B13]
MANEILETTVDNWLTNSEIVTKPEFVTTPEIQPRQVSNSDELEESNDTIPQANESGLSSTMPGTFFASSLIGNNPSIASTDDVDLIEFQLDAGDRVKIDIDAAELGSSLDSVLRLFDSAGNEVAVSDDNPAPGEDFSLDSYIDFVAGFTDTYYVGTSSFANFDYDPFVEGSGSGGSTGEYDLEINTFRIIDGTPDNDVLIGSPGNDIINGFDGNDNLIARAGNDQVNGGDGNDRLLGEDGNDLLNGQIGNDTILGGRGDDTIIGGGTETTLTFDELSFQPVDDLSVMGVTFDFKVGGIDSSDANYNSGGPGSITFVQDPSLEGNAEGILTLDFEDPISKLEFGVALNTFDEVTPGFTVELFDSDLMSLGETPVDTNPLVSFTEGLFSYTGETVQRAVVDFNDTEAFRFALDNLTFEELGNDDDLLEGGAGNDNLLGNSGNDLLVGGADDDLLDGGAGDDRLFGGTDADQFVLREGDGRDTIFDYRDGTDSFLLADGLAFEDLTITQGIGQSVISVTDTSEDLAALFGVNANDLGAEDFSTLV